MNLEKVNIEIDLSSQHMWVMKTEIIFRKQNVIFWEPKTPTPKRSFFMFGAGA